MAKNIEQPKKSVDPGKIQLQKTPVMDREIHVRINPRIVLKTFLVVIVLLGVFFLGRWSAGGLDATGYATTDLEQPAEDTEQVADAPAETTEVVEEVVAEEPVQEEEVVEEEPVEEELEPEPIITSYSNVKVKVNSARKEWFDTWGKIMSVSYTITNNEEGTILPSYLKMTVEGYNDEALQKKIPLPLSSQEIRSNQVVSTNVNIPDGFAYSEKTTGKLEEVRLSFILFDNENRPIASFSDEFDLSGN